MIDFYRHEKKMGMVTCVLDILRACSKEYCRTFAGDDFLSMSGLEKANTYVSQSSPDLITTQFLSGNKVTRDRNNEGPIGYSEIGQASHHARTDL